MLLALSVLLSVVVGAPDVTRAEPVAVLPDAELLTAMRQAHVALAGERGSARKTLGSLNAARYDDRLAAIARGNGADGARAEAARVRLLAAWTGFYASVGGTQAIDPRGGCRSQERALREAVGAAPGSSSTGRLAAAREDALRCLRRLQDTLAQTRATSGTLDAALAEARAVLGDGPPERG